MATSSILGGEQAEATPDGKDIDALGPSDSSDSGSDVQGIPSPGVAGSSGGLAGDGGSETDAGGTGERGSAVPDGARIDGDISPDQVIPAPDGDAPGATTRRGGAGTEHLVDEGADPLAERDGGVDQERGV